LAWWPSSAPSSASAFQAPDFAQGLEGITFLAGWVVGSWLIFHFWPMPVVRTVLPGWGQRPDQEADR
jgi:hypothetical protein